MQTFWDWLLGEGGAGWIIGLASLLISLYAWRHRECAPRVIVQEVKRIRLLNIHPSQRESLSVFYADAEGKQACIQNLEQKEIVIYNNGTKDILEPVQFSLGFYGGGSEEGFQGFWRLVFDDETCTSEAIYDSAQNVCFGTRIKLPYLNSYPVHQHYIRVYLISDQEVDLELLEGIGKGWSAYFVGPRQLRDLQQPLVRIVSSIGNVLIVGAFILWIVGSIKSPYAKVLFRPTTENIEAVVKQFRKPLELLQTSGYLGYLKASIQSYVLGVAFFPLFVLGVIVGGSAEWIGERVSLMRLGAQPASKFQQ